MIELGLFGRLACVVALLLLFPLFRFAQRGYLRTYRAKGLASFATHLLVWDVAALGALRTWEESQLVRWAFTAGLLLAVPVAGELRRWYATGGRREVLGFLHHVLLGELLVLVALLAPILLTLTFI
jgi:hypothetical protein